MSNLVPDGHDQWETIWYSQPHSGSFFLSPSDEGEVKEPAPFGFTASSYVPPEPSPPKVTQDSLDPWMWW